MGQPIGGSIELGITEAFLTVDRGGDIRVTLGREGYSVAKKMFGKNKP